MLQSTLFKRYLWLVDLIYNHDGITRDQINHSWSRSSLNTTGEKEIPERTFHRHKDAIKELFDIEIICNRQGEKTYSIANPEDLKSKVSMEWLLHAFSVNNILSESKELRNRILLEPVARGQHYLTSILEAMREDRIINLSYQGFLMKNTMPHEIEPYCVKYYKQRWYVLGRRTDRDVLRIFALDRIHDLTVTDKTFALPATFDAEKYFEDTIGIVVEDNCPPTTITFKAEKGQENYIRSLPLHSTQVEYETGCDSAKFRIYVQPNYDLVHELLRYGERVTVIRPKWFREKFRQIAERMSYNYSEE